MTDTVRRDLIVLSSLISIALDLALDLIATLIASQSAVSGPRFVLLLFVTYYYSYRSLFYVYYTSYSRLFVLSRN